MTSACGPPACWVWPVPRTSPSRPTITQPTRGLGSDRPMACAASANAWRMCTRAAGLRSGETVGTGFIGVASAATGSGEYLDGDRQTVIVRRKRPRAGGVAADHQVVVQQSGSRGLVAAGLV